ncbi:JmjC domain, hydroxylase-domain-containing protein [Multifurca ochricompacta]|uniref:[histone H3]-trimethyl-L-lysine(9) demethylase n=1 Tax=Multifurca ochricompacta TaxID=376703 RepID=A0AAD4LZ43_9AGAM|nr:JmjC domain, hydroxylase-domain-containing protein [Multifurca ochricompacta]
MSTSSDTLSLASSLQPDHFYGLEGTWLEPDDDPFASRGIPVFKPSMDEFKDFEGYMNKIEGWGMRSGVVKVIPPQEWTDALPPLTHQLAAVKLKNPIEQHMIGHGGLFRQQNVEKRRVFSVREWAELCKKEDRRAPSVDDIGLHLARRAAPPPPPKTRAKRGGRRTIAATKAASAGPVAVPLNIVEEVDNAGSSSGNVPTSPSTPSNDIDSKLSVPLVVVDPSANDPQLEQPTDVASLPTPERLKEEEEENTDDDEARDDKPRKPKGKRKWQTREMREAHLAERAAADEFCKDLERRYWRNCGFGTPAMYGADMEGSLFTDKTKAWNVAHLPSLLSRLIPSSSNGLPGVNTPYLYFGMWRATFAWHVEDMDLFSINYIHFGAGKFWYAVPQARASALEQAMRGHFPEPSRCPQFLRHKSYLASPMMLAKTSCRPNTLVQHAGEFVITYPRGYHAGFNLGFNCAESVNFALDSWIEVGRKAQVCNCVNDSVRINVDKLLYDRELAMEAATTTGKPKSKASHSSSSPRKRKSDENDTPGLMKKAKVTIRLKLGPRPPELEPFPCCLCISSSHDGLLPVHDKPLVQHLAYADTKVWMVHESCARVLPETWLDDVETGPVLDDGTRKREKMVFGVDAIVKDRWNLKCTACSKSRPKMHGAPIQCTRGKCSKAFHISCAREGGEHGIVYKELGEVEKDVVLVDVPLAPGSSTPMDVDGANSSPQGTATDSVDARTYGREAIKVVKKVEFQLLCPQHNPLMLEVKKANKQDKIRKDLLALAPMSRIKIRVSAGIFEVSLVRVIEESSSVEVLWDRGIKREFKWGSVVFGNLEGQTIGQKPMEAAPEAERQMYQPGPTSKSPQPLATSVTATTTTTNAAPQTAYLPYQSIGAYPYPVGAWGYHYPPFSTVPVSSPTPASTYVPSSIKYPYGAPATQAATSATSSPTTVERPYTGIQWKQPYTRPRDATPATESQAQNELTPLADQQESTQILPPGEVGEVGEVAVSATDGGDAMPYTNNPSPSPCSNGEMPRG